MLIVFNRNMSDNQPFYTDRGQSEVFGYLLIVTIGFVGVSLVLVFGGQALSLFESQTQEQKTINAFSKLDSEASTVALSEDGNRSSDVDLSLNTRTNSLIAKDTGNLRVAAVDCSAGSMSEDCITRYRKYIGSDVGGKFNGAGITENLYANFAMGTLVYEGDESEVAYQGGGVWRKPADNNPDDESFVVSSPEFYYTEQGDNTATLSPVVINTDGRQLGNSNVHISSKDNTLGSCDTLTDPCFERADSPRLDGKTVFVTIQSDYYRAWGKYFEEQVGENKVDYNDAENRVIVKMEPSSSDLYLHMSKDDINTK